MREGGEGVRKQRHLPVFRKVTCLTQQIPESSLNQPPQAKPQAKPNPPLPPRKLTWAPGQTQLPGNAEAATHVCIILPRPRPLGTPARRALGGDSLPTVSLLPPPSWHTRDQNPAQCTMEPLRSGCCRRPKEEGRGSPALRTQSPYHLRPLTEEPRSSLPLCRLLQAYQALAHSSHSRIEIHS